MSEKRILIAEDDVSTGIMLAEFLNSKGYSVEAVKNGQEAFVRFSEWPAQVVITDIEMPVMDGNQLIGHLNHVEIPPVIFVTTVHKDPALIIDIMKKGVHDYILKPVDMSDILLKIIRAFETYEMKRAFEITQKERVIRLENLLEWYKFEENIRSRDFKEISDNLFQSLLTSFNQGSGFGGLVTLMALMKSTAEKDGEFYRIQDNLFEMIMSSVESAERALQIFGDIAKIASGAHVPERLSVMGLHEMIDAEIKELSTLVALKKHKIILCDKKKFFDELSIEINRGHFIKAFREIFINALKFSQPGSEILVLFLLDNNTISIKTINDINTSDGYSKGIPLGYENLVFEPFFRLTKHVFEEYKSLDYGLGLTMVQRLITGYGGKVEIGNITDHSDIKAGPKIKVECSVSIMLKRGSGSGS